MVGPDHHRPPTLFHCFEVGLAALRSGDHDFDVQFYDANPPTITALRTLRICWDGTSVLVATQMVLVVCSGQATQSVSAGSSGAV